MAVPILSLSTWGTTRFCSYLHESEHLLPGEGHGVDAVQQRGQGLAQLKLGVVLVRSLLGVVGL